MALMLCLFAQEHGYSVVFFAAIFLTLLILCAAARVISVIADGFTIGRLGMIIRGSWSIVVVVVEAGVTVLFGILIASIIEGG